MLDFVGLATTYYVAEVFSLECGSLLPLLGLELGRDGAGSKLPTEESGSKLPESKVSGS